MMNLPADTPGSATDVVVSRAAGTGPATWAMGMLFERLAGAEETAGLLGASVVTQPPGQASPLHVHTREAEAWFLLQGAMTYRAGEQLVRMTAATSSTCRRRCRTRSARPEPSPSGSWP
jgi:hypothetical protein